MPTQSNHTSWRGARASSSRRNSSPSYPRVTKGLRTRPKSDKWKFWIFLILLPTVIAAFYVYRVNHNGLSSDAAYPGHYPNLHLAEGSKGRLKEYEGFTVAFNASNRTPDWVGWELTAEKVDGTESRSDKFWRDYDLDGCPDPADYKNSGYDKGHLCPAADQKWSVQAMSDCFVMANMCPQDHALNSGAWKGLEERERLWAKRDSALVIVAGPIYQSVDKTTIGDGVRVPSAFFKVILAPYLPKPRAIGFIFPNMRASGYTEKYAMSVDEVERITGLDFFASLPDSIENFVEARGALGEWERP